jgi:tRNA pseudouridine38-40 synthase
MRIKEYRMTNYKIIVQYDGRRYKGWQVQKNTDATIQGKLQAVLTKMSGYEVEVHGSGRTDAGVHALGQVANFKLREPKDCRDILVYFKEYLPEDIAVIDVTEVPLEFHSRLSAVIKTYRYRIWTSPIPNVFERKYVTSVEEKLDIEKMNLAAEYMKGTHDFTAFCGNRKFKKSAVRSIYDIDIQQLDAEICISVTGNGFLQNMMRILVGTLVEAGLGKRNPCGVQAVLESKNRELAGITMPPKGLCLMKVCYR